MTRKSQGHSSATPGSVWSSDDKAWIDDFIFELRSLGVSGSDIGDAVAIVYEFNSDTRGSVRDEFGDPREYAESLSFGDEAYRPISATLIVAAVASLCAFLLFVDAASAWGARQNFLLAAAQVGILIVAAVAAGFAFFKIELLLRHPWLAFALFAGFISLQFIGAMLAPQSSDDALFELSPIPVMAVCLILIIAVDAFVTVDFLRSPDEIEEPLAEARSSGFFVVLNYVMLWILPLVAIVTGIVTWLSR